MPLKKENEPSSGKKKMPRNVSIRIFCDFTKYRIVMCNNEVIDMITTTPISKYFTLSKTIKQRESMANQTAMSVATTVSK